MIPAITHLPAAPANTATSATIDAATPGFAALLASAAPIVTECAEPQAAANTAPLRLPVKNSALSLEASLTARVPTAPVVPQPGGTDKSTVPSEAQLHENLGALSAAPANGAVLVDSAAIGETEIAAAAVEDEDAEPAIESWAGPGFALETRVQQLTQIDVAGPLSMHSAAHGAASPPKVLETFVVPPALHGRLPLSGALSQSAPPPASGVENGFEAIEPPAAPEMQPTVPRALALPAALASSPSPEAFVHPGGVTETPQQSVAPMPFVTTMAALRLPRERDDREVLSGLVAIADPAPMRAAVRAESPRVAALPMMPAIELSMASAIDLAVDSGRLGTVRIGVDGGAGDLRVSLGLSPAAAALVAADAPRLIAELAAGGVQLQSLDVSGGGASAGQQQPQSRHAPASLRAATPPVIETSTALRPGTPDRYA